MRSWKGRADFDLPSLRAAQGRIKKQTARMAKVGEESGEADTSGWVGSPPEGTRPPELDADPGGDRRKLPSVL